MIARRRRRRGTQPYYGTGWMAPPPKYSTHQDYQLNQQNAGSYSGNPPPAYGQTPHQPQYSGTTTYNPNDGYYGGPQYPDVQSPPNAYQPTNVYPPPPAVPGQTK